MRSLALFLVLTLVTYSAVVRMVALDIHISDEQKHQHQVRKKLLEVTGTAKGTLGYSGSTIDTHHNIPRNQYNPRTGGTTQQPPEGDNDNQGNGGADTNN